MVPYIWSRHCAYTPLDESPPVFLVVDPCGVTSVRRAIWRWFSLTGAGCRNPRWANEGHAYSCWHDLVPYVLWVRGNAKRKKRGEYLVWPSPAKVSKVWDLDTRLWSIYCAVCSLLENNRLGRTNKQAQNLYLNTSISVLISLRVVKSGNSRSESLCYMDVRAIPTLMGGGGSQILLCECHGDEILFLQCWGESQLWSGGISSRQRFTFLLISFKVLKSCRHEGRFALSLAQSDLSWKACDLGGAREHLRDWWYLEGQCLLHQIYGFRGQAPFLTGWLWLKGPAGCSHVLMCTGAFSGTLWDTDWCVVCVIK